MKNLTVIKELQRIATSNRGLLVPDQVVEAARPKSSPLHSRFQWDDTQAAHEYRIWQARQLISVCVQILPGASDPAPIWVSLSSDRGEGRGYRTVVSVCSDKEKREQLLSDALADLAIFQRKYRMLTQLASVFAAVRKVRARAA